MGPRTMLDSAGAQDHVSFDSTAHTKRNAGYEVIPIRADHFALSLLRGGDYHYAGRTPLRQQRAERRFHAALPR